MAMDAAGASDLVQKKLAVDGLKKRLGDGKDSDKKLREACEGFESIFLQKMWEQMRKNVKKEGYLHSKDEEAYQSMFDVELAKKMTSAGGIGLADMLQQQLSQKLSKTSRSTGPGALRAPLAISPAQEGAARAETRKEALSQEELYSQAEEEAQKSGYDPARTVMEQALSELENERQVMDPDYSPEAFAPMTVAQAFARPVAPAAQAGAAQAPSERPVFSVTPMPQKVSAPGKARPVSRKGASTHKTSNANNRSYSGRTNGYPGYTPGIPGAPAATGTDPAASARTPSAGPQALTSDGGLAGATGATGAAGAAGVMQTAPAVRLDRNV